MCPCAGLPACRAASSVLRSGKEPSELPRDIPRLGAQAGFISGGRHFLSLRLIGQQDGQQAEQSAADLQGGKGEEEEEDGLHVREGHPASPGKGSARGSRGKPTETDSGPEAPPLTSSFKNTGMDKPSVQRAKPQNGGAHLGPAKYLVNYKPVTPAPKSVADFQRQLSRPLFCEDDGRPGPGYYEPPPTGRTGCSRRGQRYPGTRAFDKQKGRDPFSKVHDTRPATAPVVMHTSSPLPFSPPALQEPFAPIRAIQAMRESRAGQITRMTERVGRPATVDSTRQHEMILAAWQAKHGADQQRPGTVPGSFADAGMGMWFDEYGHPLTSAVAVGWAPDQVPQEEVAWHKTRYGAAVSGQEVNTESWATGGLRTAPKLGTMPRCSRTAELQGQRILCSSKSGFPLTAPRCNQPDTRTDLNPKHDLVMAKAPSWSLPKNRTEKPKRWVPPKNLIEAHMD